MNTQILYDRILTSIKVDENLTIDMTHIDNIPIFDFIVLYNNFSALYKGSLD